MTPPGLRPLDLIHGDLRRRVRALMHLLAHATEEEAGARRAERLLDALWRRSERTAPMPTQMAPICAVALWMATPPHLEPFLFSLPGFAASLDVADGMSGTMRHLFHPEDLGGWWARLGQDTVLAKLAALPADPLHQGWPGMHSLAWLFLMAEHPDAAHGLWPAFGHGARLSPSALIWTLGNGPLPCAHLALDALPCFAPQPPDLEDADSVVGQIKVWCAMMARRPDRAQTPMSNTWMRMLTADTCWHHAQIFADSAHAALRRAALLGVHTPHGWIDALTPSALVHGRTATSLERVFQHSLTHTSVPSALSHGRTATSLDGVFQDALTQAFGPAARTPRPTAPTDPYAVHTAALSPAPSHP